MSDNAERRVTVLLTKRQYEELVQRAGIAPMGAYIKSVLFRDKSVLEIGKVSDGAEELNGSPGPGAQATSRTSPGTRACPKCGLMFCKHRM